VRRSEQRRATVWGLYQSDLLGRPVEDVLPRDASGFTRELAQIVQARRSELDALIAAHASGWSLDRIAPLERAILRLALAELLHADEIPGERAIPAEGAIDEAVQTAKEFCGVDAPAFVNGILGAVLREMQAASS